jgi:hypothetical protein
MMQDIKFWRGMLDQDALGVASRMINLCKEDGNEGSNTGNGEGGTERASAIGEWRGLLATVEGVSRHSSQSSEEIL